MGKVGGRISSILMLALLVLLTIGLPLATKRINSFNNQTSSHKQSSDKNPFSNTNEEKTCGSAALTVNEEYIHDSIYSFNLIPFQISIAYIHAHEATYIAFHGELHCPPPNTIS